MELRHHGILGQKWGVRNGPPYPLSGGDYTPSQRKAISNKRKSGNSIYKPTSDDLQTVYRMFNYVIPYDGQGDSRKGRDMYNQRTKFFHACKEAGYGAVLDTNDAIYGGFKAKSPIIVFDMEQVVPKDVYRTNLTDQKFSTLVLVGRKLLGL